MAKKWSKELVVRCFAEDKLPSELLAELEGGASLERIRQSIASRLPSPGGQAGLPIEESIRPEGIEGNAS